MTNWQDPAVEVAEGAALVKLIHVMAGVYIWEFVINLDYEYSILTGTRKFTRTVPLYVGCRWCTLLAIIMEFVVLDAPHVDCRASILAIYVFGYLSFLLASGLVILRIYALWERSKLVIAIIVALWLATTATYIYVAVTSPGHLLGSFCDVDHSTNVRVTVLSTFVTDVVYLFLMLVGVLRWRDTRGEGGIWGLMYKQGLIWVVVYTLADLPPLVFILLNLNGPMNKMFLVPGMVVMSIGALRMYRVLLESATPDNTPVDAFGVKERTIKTAIQFAGPLHPSSRGEDTYNTGGVGLETRQVDGSLGSETV